MNPHEEVECEESYGYTADGGVDRTPRTDPEEVPGQRVTAGHAGGAARRSRG